MSFLFSESNIDICEKMVQYQVEHRAYCASYEKDPPPFQATPRGNVTTNKAEALRQMDTKLSELLERSRCVSFPTITEVRIVSEKGTLLSKKVVTNPDF